MSAPDMKAAEKAEARRQKILTKRQARMAYAAGDRSILPSMAPAEAVELEPGHVTQASMIPSRGGEGVTEMTGGEAIEAMEGVRRRVTEEAIPAARVVEGRHSAGRGHHGSLGGERGWKGAVKWEKVRVVLLMVIGILCGAMSCYLGVEGMAGISVVHVFAVIESCTLGIELAGGRKMGGGGGMMGGVIGAVMRATQVAGMIRRIWEDFAVFMVCMLGSVYVCEML